MRPPPERTGWLRWMLGLAVAVGLAVQGWWAPAVIVATAVIGGLAGGPIVGRDPETVQPDVDWRYVLPAGGLFVVAGIATIANAYGVDAVVGVEPTSVAGISFGLSFAVLSLGSLLVEKRPRVALGEGFMALGWPLLLVPVDAPVIGSTTGTGTTLLVTGGSMVLLFGPVGIALGQRLERLASGTV